MGAPGYLLDLPVTPYRESHPLQLSIVGARRTTRLERDVVIMLEHTPVFTMGRRGGYANLLVTRADLEARGIDVLTVERGGDITYHGPGQLVVYTMMRLNGRRIGVSDFVTCLEKVMVLTAASWGILARGGRTERGVWVGRRKLGSVGITVRRGITFHGLALNVSTDMAPFQWINPCGLKDCTMTSLEREVGGVVEMSMVRRQMALHISEVFGMELRRIGLNDLKKHLEIG
jgi:lipoate-protein ligase B